MSTSHKISLVLRFCATIVFLPALLIFKGEPGLLVVAYLLLSLAYALKE